MRLKIYYDRIHHFEIIICRYDFATVQHFTAIFQFEGEVKEIKLVGFALKAFIARYFTHHPEAIIPLRMDHKRFIKIIAVTHRVPAVYELDILFYSINDRLQFFFISQAHQVYFTEETVLVVFFEGQKIFKKVHQAVRKVRSEERRVEK